MIKELNCIVCPMSCHIMVEMDHGKIQQVKGNSCTRGEKFARQEVICPMRMLTTTVRIHHGLHKLLPVMTSASVPKTRISDIMEICRNVEVKAPVEVGEIIVKNIADTGVDLIASRSMKERFERVSTKNHSSNQ